MLPCDRLYLGTSTLDFFVFPKQQYRFRDLSHQGCVSCLRHIAMGVEEALRELHDTYGLAHLDVRLPNVCYHNGRVTLIDFDRAEIMHQELPYQYGDSFMYSGPKTALDLDWKQLGLMIYSTLVSKPQTQLTMKDIEDVKQTHPLVYHLVFDYQWMNEHAESLEAEDIETVLKSDSN